MTLGRKRVSYTSSWPGNGQRKHLIPSSFCNLKNFTEFNKNPLHSNKDGVILMEYSLFVDKTREFVGKNNGDIDTGVKEAVDWCIANNILREFLQKERSEIIMLSIFEYNAEEERRKLLAEVDENSAQLIEKGKEMERANTEREKQRADAAEARIRELEAKLAEMSK